jgi:hypothetical protein
MEQWKQDRIYGNRETNGIYTREKIDPQRAFFSGQNGGTYGQGTQAHMQWQMGKNSASTYSPSTLSASSTPVTAGSTYYGRSLGISESEGFSWISRGDFVFSALLTLLLQVAIFFSPDVPSFGGHVASALVMMGIGLACCAALNAILYFWKTTLFFLLALIMVPSFF